MDMPSEEIIAIYMRARDNIQKSKEQKNIHPLEVGRFSVLYFFEYYLELALKPSFE